MDHHLPLTNLPCHLPLPCQYHECNHPAIELQEGRLNEIPVSNNNNKDDDGNQVDEEIPSNQNRPKQNCTRTSDTIYKNFECNR